MSQFNQTNKKIGKCPICDTKVPVRSVRDLRSYQPNYCSQVCASQARYATRYRGTMSGPADRPKNLKEKTKWKGDVVNEQRTKETD